MTDNQDSVFEASLAQMSSEMQLFSHFSTVQVGAKCQQLSATSVFV
jgi:hypothetical protein